MRHVVLDTNALIHSESYFHFHLLSHIDKDDDKFVDCAITANAARIAQRVMEGGHDVPIAKVISRYYKSILNCKRCISLADRVYVYDNSIDDADARLLFRMTDGQLFKQYADDIPEWATTILKK